MRFNIFRSGGCVILGVVGLALAGLNGARDAAAQTAPADGVSAQPVFPISTVSPAVTVPIPEAPPAAPVVPLAWDAMQKETTSTLGQETAEFEFSVTNILDKEVTILNLVPQCGCTIAKMPSPAPWHLAPHTGGTVEISVNLAGKGGTLFKEVAVNMQDYPEERLHLVIHMPDSSRELNMLAAKTDRQSVFKGGCANCHLEPTAGKLAKNLYDEACGKCHEANPRATMVPDLHALNHPTDYAYWKMMVTIGKPGTLMPGYGQAAGGPLNDEQIDSLAKTLVKMFPSPAQTANGSQPTSALVK